MGMIGPKSGCGTLARVGYLRATYSEPGAGRREGRIRSRDVPGHRGWEGFSHRKRNLVRGGTVSQERAEILRRNRWKVAVFERGFAAMEKGKGRVLARRSTGDTVAAAN